MTLTEILNELPDKLPGRTALLTMEKDGNRYRFDYVAINGQMYFSRRWFREDPAEAAQLLLDAVNKYEAIRRSRGTQLDLTGLNAK